MMLQVALDFCDIEDALRIAEKVSRAGAHILEAGTPLIKAEGSRAISELKKRFPQKLIAADMKTMDAGQLETEIAINAGADIVSILGVSSNTTIKDAIKIAKENNKKIMVDLIGVQDKIKRAKEVELFGADYILVHTGLDEQTEGKDPFKDLKNVCNATKIPIAVAGGINDKSIFLLKEFRIEIVIVGGFITKSKNPEEATKVILSSIR
jgi:3-hexulose-6-phosphate synthase/6-phospho-3-hexuloisomerase